MPCILPKLAENEQEMCRDKKSFMIYVYLLFLVQIMPNEAWIARVETRFLEKSWFFVVVRLFFLVLYVRKLDMLTTIKDLLHSE